MSDLYLATATPQTNDSEKLLLARLAVALGNAGGAVAAVGTALASAARTATTLSPIIITPAWARGVMLYHDITVASGLGGLAMRHRRALDAAGAIFLDMDQTPGVVATGARILIQYPVTFSGTGAAFGAITPVTFLNHPLSAYMQFGVTHADASSYTYSLRYAFLR